MNLIILFLYFILVLIGVINHEMWRDELEAWLISVHSSSIGELLQNIKYECHPPLLYFFLYIIGKFTHNPVGMQYFHLFVACSVIYVFLKWAPFTRLQKILFCFGYFPFYEYGVISRNYSLGLLFLFISCILFKPKEKNYILLSLVLLLLASAHVYAMFIAVSFEIMLILDYFITNKNNLTFKIKSLLLSLIIFVLGIILLFMQLSLPEDCFYNIKWLTHFDFYTLLITLGTIWKGYFAIPALTYNFCDTNILNMTNNLWLFVGLSSFFGFLILLFSLFLFTKQKTVLFLYITSNILILLFSYMRFYGSLRHHGSLFILFVVCLWISTYYEKPNKLKNIFFNILLFCHLFYGAYAYTIDLFNPFSESKAASEYIKKNHLDNLTIIGSDDYRVSPITAYLGKRIFYPKTNRYGTFVKWDKKAGLPTQLQNIFQKAIEMINQKKENLLLVLSDELIVYRDKKPFVLDVSYLMQDVRISKIAEFSKSIRKDENYYIYLIELVNKTN